MRILVVDDDQKIRTLLRNVLETESFEVVEAEDGATALTEIRQNNYDLITLDLNLGTDDGLAVAREIRGFSNVPIIMVTGKNDVIDRVVGLELGADDYITKPFHVREVLARVKTVLKRIPKTQETMNNSSAQTKFEDKNVEDDFSYAFDGMVARPAHFELLDRSGKKIELTSGDFRLLTVFLDRPKRILSRDQLMDLIGGLSWNPNDRTIDNQVARLRKKTERDPTAPQLIKTVRGIGYSLACDVTKTPL